MTVYKLTPPATLPSLAVQEAKEKHHKILDAAAHTRKANYLAFLKKLRLQASSDLI
jgi:hypothetical protein